MTNNRFYAIIALWLFLSSDHPGLLFLLRISPKMVLSGELTQSFRYSEWPGRLEGCVFESVQVSSRLGCALVSAARRHTVFQFKPSTSECNLCLTHNVSRYSLHANGSFFLLRSFVWTSPDFLGGLRMDAGIYPGQIFEIFGQITPTDDRFTVFWRPGPVHTYTADLAIKTLFSLSTSDGNRQNLELKSKVDGVVTVKTIYFTNPLFRVGETFRVLVLVTSSEFVVYIKDEFCCCFAHVYTNLSGIHYLFVLINPIVQQIIF